LGLGKKMEGPEIRLATVQATRVEGYVDLENDYELWGVVGIQKKETGKGKSKAQFVKKKKSGMETPLSRVSAQMRGNKKKEVKVGGPHKRTSRQRAT